MTVTVETLVMMIAITTKTEWYTVCVEYLSVNEYHIVYQVGCVNCQSFTCQELICTEYFIGGKMQIDTHFSVCSKYLVLHCSKIGI
jgi:hypothetical protein